MRALNVVTAEPINSPSKAKTRSLPIGLAETWDSENAESRTASVVVVTPPESAIPEPNEEVFPEPKLFVEVVVVVADGLGVGEGVGVAGWLMDSETRIAAADSSRGSGAYPRGKKSEP